MKHRKGTDLECDLPDCYDVERTHIATFNGHVIVAHPDYQPCILKDGELTPIEPKFA